LFSTRDHAGGLYCVIEMSDSDGHVFEEMASRLGQADTAMAPLKQEDAEVLFQHLNPLAHSRLADPQCRCRTSEIQVLSNRQRL